VRSSSILDNRQDWFADRGAALVAFFFGFGLALLLRLDFIGASLQSRIRRKECMTAPRDAEAHVSTARWQVVQPTVELNLICVTEREMAPMLASIFADVGNAPLNEPFLRVHELTFQISNIAYLQHALARTHLAVAILDLECLLQLIPLKATADQLEFTCPVAIFIQFDVERRLKYADCPDVTFQLP
jgi:hypothetical protein